MATNPIKEDEIAKNEQTTPPVDQTAEIEALKAAVAALTEKLDNQNASQGLADDDNLPPLPVDKTMEEYVEVQLFYDGKKYKDDVFVAVNGETCLIKRGTPVRIKRKFKLALDSSQLQDVAAASELKRLNDEYEQKKNRLI